MPIRKKAMRKKSMDKRMTRKVKTKSNARKITKTNAKTSSKSSSIKMSAIRPAYNKTQLLSEISDNTELSRKEVLAVFEQLSTIAERHLKKGGAREFTIPGLVKCVVKHKPATKARKGINPFTKEATTFKAKPARDIVKVRPLKRLKEMAQ